MTAVTPFIFESHPVRIVDRDGEPWFVAADVCKVLEHSDTSKAVARLDEDEKDTNIVRTLKGDQALLVINESGMWSLVLTSRKPAAKRFKKWVTSEVLPAIRKTGGYGVHQSAPPPAAGAGSYNVTLTFEQYSNLMQEHVAVYKDLHRMTVERAIEYMTPGKKIWTRMCLLTDILINETSLTDSDIETMLQKLMEATAPSDWVAWRRHVLGRMS